MIRPLHTHTRGPLQKPMHSAPPSPMETPRKRPRKASAESSILNEDDLRASTLSFKRNSSYRKHMYLTFVNNALLEKRKGRVEPYEELVSQFRQASRTLPTDTEASIAQLRSWLDALSHVVSQLDRPNASLVDALLSLPWSTADEAFVKSYTSFTGMLVSARPEYLGVVLDRIVKDLTYNSGLRAVDAISQQSSSSLTRGIVYNRQHALVSHLLSLIPTLPSSLVPVLTKYFPHKREPKVAQVTYIKNLLMMSEYCPQLGGRILGLVVERAVMIDVEVQIAYEDLETAADPVNSDDLFELDPFDLVIGNDPQESEEDEGDLGDTDLENLSSEGEAASDGERDAEKPTDDAVKHTVIHSMVTKLDAILKLLFDYFTRVGPVPLTSLDPASSPTDVVTQSVTSLSESRLLFLRPHFLHLLTIFEHTILPTFRTRYTQFLLFYFTSLDPYFADLFQGVLLSKALLFEPDQTMVIRLASISYIAGFVSRARCVGKESCRHVVGLLCEYLARRLDSEEEEDGDRDVEAFYAIAQAVMVIFCFRWRDLQEVDDENDENDDDDEITNANEDLDPVTQVHAGAKWMPQLNVMQRAVTSSLNPLKHCFKHVVHQFAAVANHTNFLYCHSIMEANRRSLAESYENPTTGKSANSSSLATIQITRATHLDSFFPFDPYTLPATEGYIEGLYRTWANVKPEGFENEDDSDDGVGDAAEDDEEDDDGIDHLMSGSTSQTRRDLGQLVLKSDDDLLGVSFGGLSISPERHMRPA